MADDQYELDFGEYDAGVKSEDKSDDLVSDLEESLKISRTLAGIVEEMKSAVCMDDWTVRLKYAPDPDNENIADVSCTVHKEADITFYQFRPDMVYDDVLHELMHCKVFLIRNSYAKVISHYGEMLGELVTEYEELVVDDLARMAKTYIVDEDSGEEVGGEEGGGEEGGAGGGGA